MSEPVVHLSPAARLAAALTALLAGPVFLLADTSLALTRGWEPRANLHRLVIAASLVLVVAVGILASLPNGRQFLVSRWTAVIVVVFSSALTWAAAEGLARAFPQIGARFVHSRGPHVQRIFRPDPRWVAGIQGPSLYTTNDLGVRGGPVSGGAYRILCLGGSTTECSYLDDSETWPHRLMERLNGFGSTRGVWIGSLGIAGYTSIEHLEFMNRSPLARSMDSIIFLFGVNDFTRFLTGSLELGPRPLWRRTALASALLALRQRYFLRHLLYEVEDPTGRNLQERRKLRHRGETDIALPSLDRAIREYEERVEQISRLCQGREIRCVFLTQPVLWRQGLDSRSRASLWMGSDERGRYFAPEMLRQGLDRYNRALLTVCNQLGLECVDLSALSGREDLFYDDCHFTEKGAVELAQLVSQHFLTQGER